MGPEARRSLLAGARRRRFGRGDIVFHEGDAGDTLHLVAKGRLAVRVTTPLGDVATLLIVGPGEHFGELAVISPAPRNATVVALEPSETLSVHRDQFDELRRTYPDLDQFLLETVV